VISKKRTYLCGLMVLLPFFLDVPVFAQTLLQITSPSNSTGVPLFQEGQTYTITLSADPSVQNIGVVTPPPLPGAQPTANPLQFTLTLPTSIAPTLYTIEAIGTTAGGLVEASPVQVDVERQDAPVSLTVQPTFMTFSVGDTRSADLRGTFADGTTLPVRNSSFVTYTSEDTSIVTVASGGLMTAVGPGQTTVIVKYGLPDQSAWTVTSFQVIVPPPPPSGPAPAISSISPTSGAPGVTQVTINGSNFGASQGSGYVQIGSISASTISSWSDTQIVATGGMLSAEAIQSFL